MFDEMLASLVQSFQGLTIQQELPTEDAGWTTAQQLAVGATAAALAVGTAVVAFKRCAKRGPAAASASAAPAPTSVGETESSEPHTSSVDPAVEDVTKAGKCAPPKEEARGPTDADNALQAQLAAKLGLPVTRDGAVHGTGRGGATRGVSRGAPRGRGASRGGRGSATRGGRGGAVRRGATRGGAISVAMLDPSPSAPTKKELDAKAAGLISLLNEVRSIGGEFRTVNKAKP